MDIRSIYLNPAIFLLSDEIRICPDCRSDAKSDNCQFYVTNASPLGFGLDMTVALYSHFAARDVNLHVTDVI